MSKFSSQKAVLVYFAFLFVMLCSLQTHADYLSGYSALIERVIDEQTILGYSETSDWEVGEILPVISQNAKVGVFAFIEVQNIKKIGFKKYEIRFKVIRQSRRYLIQKGDAVRRLDLGIENEEYVGTTDLIIKKSQLNISSRYRPLFTQGLAIGETAQTLYKNEFLFNYLGNLSFGATDWLTLGTFTTVNVLGRPNANFKVKFWDSESATLSTGLSYVRLTQEDSATLNMNFYWDSTSSETLISHTFLGLGLIRWEKAADAAAIKELGSSSFQTGYEIVMSNWDRILIGPNYNFEKKALGGYVSYIWVYDRFHMQVSINATDITHFRLDPSDGYYGFFDLYWRF